MNFIKTIDGFANALAFKTKKNSPEIKFWIGVVAFGAALYSTHKAALKSREILEKRKEDLQVIDEVKAQIESGDISPEEYSPEDERNDRSLSNLYFAINMVKNYALPAGCTIVSILAFRGAMVDYRNLALSINAAYNTLLMKYNHKMGFIKRQLGEEKFKELEEGFKTEQIVNAQSTGLKDPKEKKEYRDKCNPYSRFFDETHSAWTGIPEVDKLWLLGKQNELDETLQRNGQLILNDAYIFTGYEPTKAGQVMGWIRDNPDGTINHVDFGIFNIDDPASRWFVNGLEPVFLIDFNIDPKPIVSRCDWDEV